ncbi:hypothetical protein [Paraburkholderia phosphatilytica]|uniref:hypothetical protein n=1 Tax=Paraburkholderia phosphatilytica TaxID=2282883 RepID=UPI0013DEFD44|nr:hypothetical protein [Paraburkholderia phosphatilytica]
MSDRNEQAAQPVDMTKAPHCYAKAEKATKYTGGHDHRVKGDSAQHRPALAHEQPAAK